MVRREKARGRGEIHKKLERESPGRLSFLSGIEFFGLFDGLHGTGLQILTGPGGREHAQDTEQLGSGIGDLMGDVGGSHDHGAGIEGVLHAVDLCHAGAGDAVHGLHGVFMDVVIHLTAGQPLGHVDGEIALGDLLVVTHEHGGYSAAKGGGDFDGFAVFIGVIHDMSSLFIADLLGERASSMFDGAPFGQGETLHGTENSGLQTGVAALELIDQFFDFLPLGVAIGRAGVEDHGHIQPLGGVTDEDLAAVEQGADLGDAGAVEEGDRLETGQAAFIEQGEEEGLDGVVVVMAQSDFSDAHILQRVVQSAPAHLGAHGAGILFLSKVEDDMVDLALDEGVWDIQLLTVFGHGGEVHALPAIGVAHVKGNGDHIEGNGIELAQFGHGGEQDKGVLAAGDTHGNGVVGLDHIVIFHAAAREGEDFVHVTS